MINRITAPMKALMIAAIMPPPNYNADLRQQPACDQTTDNPNDNVADQSVATALNRHTGKPTCDGADDQPNDECLCVHVSPQFVNAQKGRASQPCYNRFLDGPGRREAALGQCAPNLWIPHGPMFLYGFKVGDLLFIFIGYPSVNRAIAKNRACSLHRRFNGCARCRNICGSSRCRDDA
jgi:Protein of unknown function (DUF1810)